MRILLVLALLAGGSPVAADPLPTPERRQELLFEAARLGRADMVELLVKTGADVNAHDARGFTPLILAAYAGELETAEALLAAGADACKPDASRGNSAQMGVAFRGNDAIAARLLREGCDINARNNAGQTALMMAALFNRGEQIAMLLAAGADPTLADASGRTAASVARDQGNEALARKLAGSQTDATP